MCLASAGGGRETRLGKEAKGETKGPSLGSGGGERSPWIGGPQQTLRLDLWAKGDEGGRVPKHKESLYCLRILGSVALQPLVRPPALECSRPSDQ